jgi:thymidine phosphorylase
MGDPLATVHARNEAEAEQAAQSLLVAIELGSEPSPSAPLILDRIG